MLFFLWLFYFQTQWRSTGLCKNLYSFLKLENKFETENILLLSKILHILNLLHFLSHVNSELQEITSPSI